MVYQSSYPKMGNERIKIKMIVLLGHSVAEFADYPLNPFSFSPAVIESLVRWAHGCSE